MTWICACGRISTAGLWRCFAAGRVGSPRWTCIGASPDSMGGAGRSCTRGRRLVTFGGIDVQVLGPEDHLRVLCLHQLKHGAPSPLWLCDVAVALETRPPVFDWDRVLGPDRRQADWVACAIGLAHQFLEVPIDDTPVASRAQRLPGWLAPSVLQQWARHAAADFHGPHASPQPGAS